MKIYFRRDIYQEEAAGSAQRLGYRRMWERLRRKNIRVKRYVTSPSRCRLKVTLITKVTS